MAGLSRSPSKTVSFTWQPVQNSGAHLRVEVLAQETDSQKPAVAPPPAFQVVLTQANGQWAVSDAAKTSLFSSSTDSVILADAQGRILQLSLETGLATPLSAPGFYLPDVDSSSSYPSQVSPDGRWLALVQPGSGTLAGTWLVALDGQAALHFSNYGLNLAWSPDSQKVAYFDPLDPNVLKITTLATEITDPLTAINGTPFSIAWSPTGDMIGISFSEDKLAFDPSGPEGVPGYIDIGLVELATGKFKLLARALTTDNTLSPDALFWTADGQELWYGPARVAIDIQDGSAHPLVAQPVVGELLDQQADLLRFPQTGQLFNNSLASLLSPDWQNLAGVDPTYFIGLLSSLQQAGLKLAPSVKVSHFPATDVSGSWSWVDSPLSGINLQVPTGWSVWQPGQDDPSSPLVVANLSFADPFGFASLGRGDLYISISKVPMAAGQTPAGWYSQIEASNQGGQLYTPVTIAGIKGFRRVLIGDLASQDEIMLPAGNSIVVIDKYPLVSDYDLVYKQILATLTLR